MQWADLAIANTKNFNTVFVKAGLLQQTGSSDATAMYDEASELANIGQLNFMGYQLVGRKEYDKALEYFLLNVERNPEDANVHDSLGECYKTMGDDKNAIKAFKKSLALDPPANVKANSIRLLKELGEDTSEYETSE